MKKAQRAEAFQFLESELRRAALTLPVPGGLAYWNGPRPPVHPGLTLLQHREPATMQLLDSAPEGLGLMGTPDRHARPSWLAPLNETPDDVPSDRPNDQPTGSGLPMWLQAAVRLGTKFIRLAAAGIPPATTNLEPKCQPSEVSGCCLICGKPHPTLMDEYYFWIEDARRYDAQEQIAEWGATADDPGAEIVGDPQTDWHRADQLPGLLHWESEWMVHLRWCRVHNGEFQQPRRSYEGVRIAPGAQAELVFTGRRSDSLQFEITGGQAPAGFPAPPLPPPAPVPPPPPPPGFRYDLVSDEAIVLPQIVTLPSPAPVGRCLDTEKHAGNVPKISRDF